MSESKPNSGPGRIAVILGGLALVLCCAGPTLIAGGALSAIGTALSSPFVIAIGLALVMTAIAITLRHRVQGRPAKPGDKRR
jgi:mercuric ion transport protein